MSWADAAAMAGPVITAAFTDPQQLEYSSAKLGEFTFSGIKIDEQADEYNSQGRNLRRVTWEIEQSDLPGDASNRDFFVHAGRKWEVKMATRRDDIGKWHLDVSDGGEA